MADANLTIVLNTQGAGAASRALADVTRHTDNTEKSIKRLSNAMDKGSGWSSRSQQMGFYNSKVNSVSKSFEVLTQRGNGAVTSVGNLHGAMGGFVGIAVASKIIEIADAMALMKSRMEIFAGGAAQGKEAMMQLMNTANVLGQPVESTVGLFTRMNKVIQEMGGSNQDTINTIGTLGKVIAISGVTARESQAAMLQLGQAFASGKLAGKLFIAPLYRKVH